MLGGTDTNIPDSAWVSQLDILLVAVNEQCNLYLLVNSEQAGEFITLLF